MIGPLVSPRFLRRMALGLVFAATASLLTAGLPTPANGVVCTPISPPPTYTPPWQLVNGGCGGPEPDTFNLCSTGNLRWCWDLITYTDPNGTSSAIYVDRYDCLVCGGSGGGPGGGGGPIEH